MRPMGRSQQRVFEYLRECSANGIVPTVREICAATGLSSTSTVHSHLKGLEERGLIERQAGLNRCIRIVGEESCASVPILGRIAAGVPILACEDIEGYVPISDELRRGRELFALRVQGDSMIEAGIFDGDVIVVHHTPTAENGEIVAALIDGEATVKRFYRESGHIRLQPENSAYEPIIANDVTILGKVVSLIRNY